MITNQPNPSDQIQRNETSQSSVDNATRSSPKPEPRGSKVQGQNHELNEYLMFHVYCEECSKIIDSSTLWLHFQDFPDHTDATKSLTEFNQFELKLRQDSCAKRRSLAPQLRASSSQDKAIDYPWKKKRKMNAYLFWASKTRKKFFRHNRDKTFREVSQIMSKTWHCMHDAKKKKWLNKCRRQNQSHAIEDLN